MGPLDGRPWGHGLNIVHEAVNRHTDRSGAEYPHRRLSYTQAAERYPRTAISA
jgi:hypothetical protein